MQTNEAATIGIAKKEFPSLDPAVVEAAVKRMLGDDVYPKSVDITPEALKVAMETQIALGNLAAQPDYKTFVATRYIQSAVALH
jgi:NitT/TauT family transport system substrate-binding protein